MMCWVNFTRCLRDAATIGEGSPVSLPDWATYRNRTGASPSPASTVTGTTRSSLRTAAVQALVYFNGLAVRHGREPAAAPRDVRRPPAWNTLPCWYLLGTEDKAIPLELQRFMAETANATIVEVPASHVSFVSQPEAATQLILQAVEATAVAGTGR